MKKEKSLPLNTNEPVITGNNEMGEGNCIDRAIDSSYNKNNNMKEMGDTMSYIIYFVLIMIIPIWAQFRVKGTYKKYSNVASSSQMKGAEVARKILDSNGLYHVNIEEVRGVLSDHYDPRTKTVRLSSGNFHGHSIAAAAVAAHEVGSCDSR